MAIEQGIALYTCDRCGYTEYVDTKSPESTTFTNWKRYTKDGDIKPIDLCADCANQYQAMLLDQDLAFNQWMEEAKEEQA